MPSESEIRVISVAAADHVITETGFDLVVAAEADDDVGGVCPDQDVVCSGAHDRRGMPHAGRGVDGGDARGPDRDEDRES